MTAPTRTPVPTTVATVDDPSRPAPDVVAHGRAGIDATRGLALLGLIAVQVLPATDDAGAPTWSWTLAAGTAAATVALLTGTTIAAVTGRRRVRFWTAGASTAATLVTCALLIGALGLALGSVTAPDAPGLVLVSLAALFLLAVPLVLLPTGALFGLGTALVVAAPALAHLATPHVPGPVDGAATLGTLIAHPADLLARVALTGDHPVVIWSVYLCFGLALGRVALGARRVAVRLVVVGVPTAVVAKVVSQVLLTKYGGLAAVTADATAARMDPEALHDALTLGPHGATPAGTWWWQAVATPGSASPLEVLYTLGVVAALLGVVLLLGGVSTPGLRGLVAAVRVPLAAAGGMLLTLYTAHVLFDALVDDYEAGTSFALQAVLALALALLWWATAGRGPLETAVAALASRAGGLGARPGSGIRRR